MKQISYQEAPENIVTDPAAKGAHVRVLIGPADGAKNFVMRRFRINAGGYTPLHRHEWEHEIFILAGQGGMMTESGPRPIKAGEAILVAGNELHQFQNPGPADLEFLCLIPAEK